MIKEETFFKISRKMGSFELLEEFPRDSKMSWN